MFEDETLVDGMMAEVEGERGALPLLAFAMSKLWERRNREQGLLTRRSYEQIGAVGGALAQHAETVMEQIGAERHPMVRELFRNLVTSQGTRVVRDRDQLLSVFSAAERPPAEQILGLLIDARLLTSYEMKGEDGAERRRIEIVHESLLSEWPRLVRWHTQEADSAQLRDQLRHAARLWEQKGKTDDLLWTGTAFREFELWHERYPGGLTSSEESFASAMAERAARGRRRRRLAVGTVFVALLAVLAVVWNLGQQAREEARRSDAARLLMIAEDMSGDNTLALAAATASLEREDTRDARLLALRTLNEAPVRNVLIPPDTLISMIGARLSPDGRFLAMVNEDGVQIRPHDGGEPRSLTCEEPAVRHRSHDINFHPEGKYLAATRVPAHLLELVPFTERLLTLWSIEDGRHLRTWRTPQVAGCLVEVRGDPPYLLVNTTEPEASDTQWLRYTLDSDEPEDLGTFFDTYTYWMVDKSGRRLLYPDGNEVLLTVMDSLQSAAPVLVGRHENEVHNAIFNHDEDMVASVDGAGVIRMWSRQDDGSFELVFDHFIDDRVQFVVSFDHSNSRLAYIWGNTARIDIFELAHPRARPTRCLPSRLFAGVASFSQDDRWLASGWCDKRLGGGREYYFYSLAHSRPRVFNVLPVREGLFPEYFLPDGSVLVARDNKQELLLCEVMTSEPDCRSLWRNPGDFECSLPGPDGRYIAINNRRRDRVLVILTDGSEPITLDKPQGIIYGIDIEPGGRRVAVSGGQLWPKGLPDEPIITIHDLQTGEKQVLQAEGECGFYGVGFLPDEKLFSYSHEGLLLWDLTNGQYELLSDQKIDALPGDLDAARRFLVVKTPRGVTLWDLQERTERLLPIPTEKLNHMVISPDAGFVVGAMDDKGVLVLPLDSDEPYLLLGHTDCVDAVWVSPDSKEIRSAGEDGLVLSWDVPTGPRLHSMPYAELLEFLRRQTNMRVVPDVDAADGYRIVYDRFPGWEMTPSR
jgi:WD40 repeat protein